MSEYYIDRDDTINRIIDVIENPATGDFEFASAFEAGTAYMTPAREPQYTQTRVHPSVLRAKLLQAEKASNAVNSADIVWHDAKATEVSPIGKTIDTDVSLKHALRGTVRRLAGLESEQERAVHDEIQAIEERERLINKIIEENFTPETKPQE